MLTRKPSLDVAPTIPATVAAAEELYTAAATYLQFWIIMPRRGGGIKRYRDPSVCLSQL